MSYVLSTTMAAYTHPLLPGRRAEQARDIRAKRATIAADKREWLGRGTQSIGGLESGNLLAFGIVHRVGFERA
jgi:hypothetical protein